MSESLIQPQFHPTMRELAGRRWRLVQGLFVAFAALALIYQFHAVVLPGPSGRQVVIVRGKHPVNFLFTAPLQRVRPTRDEIVALQTPASMHEPVRFDARPLTLPPYKGDPGAALVLYSVKLDRYLAAKHPGLIIRNEGRTRINLQPAYQVTWQTRVNGHTTFGRDVMLVPDVYGSRIGAIMEMVSVISPHVPAAAKLGVRNPLRLSLHSFRLGAQRPHSTPTATAPGP